MSSNGGRPERSEPRKGRILIIEDEALIAFETSSHLEEWGYEVCGVAATGREALCRAAQERPQLALVDVNLKDGDDGVTVARLLREHWGAAVVFLTGSSDRLSRQRMLAARPAGCVFKPYSPTELRSAVAHALAVHRSEGPSGGNGRA